MTVVRYANILYHIISYTHQIMSNKNEKIESGLSFSLQEEV